MAKKRCEFKYDLAVSFAGEDRAIVERFVKLLQSAGLDVFYDADEQGELWGKDLYVHLDDVYKHKARFCVMFISEPYAKKRWTNHERQSAQERAFNENREYILPVRLDDTAIPGIRGTVGYLDLRRMKIEKIAEIAIDKVRLERGAARAAEPTANTSGKSAVKRDKASSAVVTSSGNWILLNGGFYNSQSVERPDDKHFVVSITSDDAATDSRLEAIRNHRNSGGHGISFAYASDAYFVRCESATSIYEGGAHKWKIKLAKDDNRHGGYMESSYSDGQRHYSADDLARMRAEWILLDKHPAPGAGGGSSADITAMLFTIQVQGNSSPIRWTGSPIAELAKSIHRSDSEQFLTFARLVALFYLKATGAVEHVEKLTLGPLKRGSVHVAFRGVRARRYVNADPELISIDGDCPLPPK